MPVNLNKAEANIGGVVFDWEVNEYEKHDRNKRWYVITAVIGVALLLYSVISGNYLFALVVVLFGIVLFLQDMQQPMRVSFAVTETGIVVGNTYYPFKEITNYWIIYNPPEVKNIYFTTNSILRHRLQIPLLDNDPRPIREYLNEFLVEDLDQEEEPLSDRLGRMFKLH
ncbi:MAG: Uncharacterized protein G01um101413_781 [Parcubacteria group bacterium Gr01-1014_13]|nr:MAG: Uncharacterized protein G01um101413_781 [Parcubacteria group bacterium Gr01-1014_13]